MTQPRTIIHLSFTPQEMESLFNRAVRVGMAVTPFIKHEALHGIVRGFQLRPLTEHVLAIDAIAQDVHTILNSPHPDKWLYEYDLARIEDKLKELILIEKDIQSRVRRRLA